MSEKSIWKYFNIAVYFLFAIILIFFINEKSNLHMDEISSYCVANNTYDSSISIKVEYDKKYDNPEEVWLRQMAVMPGHRFDYKNVYEEISYDNHPPLYFYLLHTVSSFFPGVYSKWFAGIVNIIVAMGIMFFSQKIIWELTEDKICIFAGSLFLCISGGIISSATYFRNYFIGMFFVSAYIYVLIKGLKKIDIKFLVSVILLAVTGVMTHYYLAIFYFFISVFFVAVLLFQKRIKDIFKYISSALLSVVIYLICDFEAVAIVFSGDDRSGEVFSNLTATFSQNIMKIVRCMKIVDTQVFSGFMLPVLAVALVLYIIRVATKSMQDNKAREYIIAFGGIAGYIIFVSVITVYETPRYFYPVYGALLVVTFCFVWSAVNNIKRKELIYIILFIIFMVCTAVKFKANIHYLYRSTKPFIEKSKEYSNADCIFITEHSYNVNASFYEMKNYNSVTFYNYDNIEKIVNADVNTDNGLIVSYDMACDTEKLNEVISRTWPELTNILLVGSHEGNTSYYYSK